jgi:sortase A
VIQKIGKILILLGLIIISIWGYKYQKMNSSMEVITKKELELITDQSYLEVNPTIIEKARENESVSNQVLGNKIGILYIPKVYKKYEVYWGTDEKTLDQGVGMYSGNSTTTPNGMGHTVLSGHRDTVFTQLKNIKIGDELILEYTDKKFKYVITKIWITDKDDLTVIVPRKSPTLTLTTCYPFEFVGDAPERYIIESDLISLSK